MPDFEKKPKQALETNEGDIAQKRGEEVETPVAEDPGKGRREALLEQQAENQKAQDLQEASVLLGKLTGDGSVERGTVVESTIESNADSRPIEERIGHPQTEMFKKYGEAMRQTVEELSEALKQRNNAWSQLSVEKDHGKSTELAKEAFALDEKVRQLRNDLYGNEDIQNSADRSAAYEYEETIMSDPYMVLRLAESGEFYEDTGKEEVGSVVTFARLSELSTLWNDKGGIGKVGENLRGNAEFVKRLLDIIPQTQVGFFWSHVTGEAKKSKDLFIAAVAKDRTNFQFGTDEWKKDPEVQKIALDGGLAQESLQKIMNRVR